MTLLMMPRAAPMNEYEIMLAQHVLGGLKPAESGYIKGYRKTYKAAAQRWMYIVTQTAPRWTVHGVGDPSDFKLFDRAESQLRKFLPTRKAYLAGKRGRSDDAGDGDGDGSGVDGGGNTPADPTRPCPRTTRTRKWPKVDAW